MSKEIKLTWFNWLLTRWGRDENKSTDNKPEQTDEDDSPANSANNQENKKPVPRQKKEGPPDLEEIWKDITKMLQGKGQRGGNNKPNRPGNGMPKIEFLNFNKLIGLILAVIFLLWTASGFYIVKEGQKAVVTQFGRYHMTKSAGLNWRFPNPIQDHEIVNATQLKAVEVGDDNVIVATGLKTSGMLTSDGNIIEIKFEVQYRLKVDENGVRDYLFETRDPDEAVKQVAESAIREVVGKMSMDAAIDEERDQIALRVRALTQDILDLYRTGIDVVQVNMLQSGVRPPEKVQAAFDDVLKANQEAERMQNEATAYANNKVPRAQGVASRLLEEARAYSVKAIAQAQGDAKRFELIVAEYKKAPKVVKDRIYIDTMQEVFNGINKVIVDNKQNSNLLFLPLDKLLAAKQTTDAQEPRQQGSDSQAMQSQPVLPEAQNNDERSRVREQR